MKKMILILSFCALCFSSVFAKPIEWHASGTFEIGRPRRGCDGFWVCITITEAGWGGAIRAVQGNPRNAEHGIGVGTDNKLYLIINEVLLKKNQPEKLALLKNQSTITFDESEQIPLEVLKSIHYTGSGFVAAGSKKVTFENGYYFIELN